MTSEDLDNSTGQDSQAPAADSTETARRPPRAGLFGLWRQIKEAGRDVAAVARGKLSESASYSDDLSEDDADAREPRDQSDWKVKVLHSATEKLRGAADGYIAAKLDEIEARVDSKLDHVEQRIDEKILKLHRQLRRMRDRELRHRLRLLKITLIFTVLVACASLVYKWLVHYIFN